MPDSAHGFFVGLMSSNTDSKCFDPTFAYVCLLSVTDLCTGQRPAFSPVGGPESSECSLDSATVLLDNSII